MKIITVIFIILMLQTASFAVIEEDGEDMMILSNTFAGPKAWTLLVSEYMVTASGYVGRIRKDMSNAEKNRLLGKALMDIQKMRELLKEHSVTVEGFSVTMTSDAPSLTVDFNFKPYNAEQKTP